MNIATLNTGQHYFAINSEVNEYCHNVRLAGGKLSYIEVQSLDIFVSSLKPLIWAKIEVLGIILGGFKSAGVKLKHSASVSPFSNVVGFYADDYSPALGLSGSAAVNAFRRKYIDTNVEFSKTVLNNRNISVGIYSTSTNAGNFGVCLGDASAALYMASVQAADGNAANSNMKVTQLGQSNGRGLVSITSDTNAVNTYQGAALRDTKAESGAGTPTGTLRIFQTEDSFYYGGSISAYYAAQYFSATEIATLSAAFDTLHLALNRTSTNKNIFFGDSITYGVTNELQPQQLGHTTDRWSTIVNAAIGGLECNSGLSGTVLQNTTPKLTGNGFDRYNGDIIGLKPNKVFILYGVNDLRYNGASFTSSIFNTQLTAIVQALIASGIPSQNITLGSPPFQDPTLYASYSPFNAGSTTKQADYTAQVASVASANGCKYFDIYNDMLNNGGTSLLSSDGVHPNSAGHLRIANGMLAAA